ncbi:hypothetical protein KFU94_71185 [Chloroflexi bacterium TSY]|nr:hypothetical protein [Chloroflexi bacterium TSY]
MTNRTDCNAKRILSIYLLRWPIETVYQDGKQLLGLDEYCMRTAHAFQNIGLWSRGLFSCTLIVWDHHWLKLNFAQQIPLVRLPAASSVTNSRSHLDCTSCLE